MVLSSYDNLYLYTQYDNFYWFLQTKLYIEDWIGLKTLDKAGRVKYISVTGDHIKISNGDMRKYVIPYLQG